MSESRKDVLLKALEAEVGGASVDPGTLFTEDIVGWSPYATVQGLPALAELSTLRETAFSNVVIMFRGLDEDVALEATGRHVQLAGVSVADFREGKIWSYRTYFDDLSMIEQIVGV